MSGNGPAPRGSLAGVRMILRYNWPLYVAGLATAAAGAAVASSTERHLRLRTTASVAALGAGWLAVASLAVSWWVYDRSELYRWTWLTGAVPDRPARVLVVHAGLDEASEPVQRVWPEAHVESVDVHGGVGPTTASLRRALSGSVRGSGPHRSGHEFDAVVAFLAAHEIRAAHGRVELLGRLRDRVRAGGRLVLVEHVRDLANALAYGPAIGHFYPAGEWRRAIQAAGWRVVGEERLTPFVVLFTAEKPE